MLMDVGLDTGDIIKIEKIDVADNEMVETLFERLTEIALHLTVEVLQNFSSFTPMAQDDTLSTHCSKITKADGEVEFTDAQTLYNKYRAFTPWPGIYLKSGLKLKKISLEEMESSNEAGKILAVDTNSIVVACQRGSIRIERIQAPSKKEVDILSYINGKRLTLEDTIS
jgi:methionyl-tRNA formyltransferase